MKTAVSRMNAASPSIVRERLSVSFAAVLELDGFEVVAVVVDVSGDAVLDAVSAFVVAGVWVGASEDGDEASEQVYCTRYRDYAALYASMYGKGDVYQVRPVGELEASDEDFDGCYRGWL